jgi:muramoyltetrapeptide carboxypeptidase
MDPARLERGIAYLEARGYSVSEARNLRTAGRFLAGSDEERADGYRRLLTDGSVDAIFFARGGYGSSRTLRYLDVEEMRANPKIHLGGSDLTALFSWIRKHTGLVTFYGPMVAVEMAGKGAEDLDWESVLRGGSLLPHSITSEDVIQSGAAEGTLVGGCLSLLASLCGTPEQVSGDGTILFWEDVGEDTYRLDRLLTQLERAGTLDGLHGMVIGSVLPRPGGESPEAVRQYLRQRFEGAPFPVAMGLQAGHLENARTLPLGARARLYLASPDQSKVSSLSFEGPVVR